MKTNITMTSAPQPLANPLNVFNHIQNEVVSDRVFRDITVSGTLLSRTQFQRCLLSGCAFFSTSMNDVEFVGCTFVNCNFWFTDLASCNFIACTFIDCKWDSCTANNCNAASCAIDQDSSVFFSSMNTSMEGCYSSGPIKGPVFSPVENENLNSRPVDEDTTQVFETLAKE